MADPWAVRLSVRMRTRVDLASQQTPNNYRFGWAFDTVLVLYYNDPIFMTAS